MRLLWSQQPAGRETKKHYKSMEKVLIMANFTPKKAQYLLVKSCFQIRKNFSINLISLAIA